MRPSDVLGIVAGIAGGLPPLHLPKRRERKPDPVAEAAAIAKRARKAAKRAEDERRTAEGRSRELNQPWRRGPMGMWDWPSIGQHLPDPQWRIRSRERRALPGMERPWFARYKGCHRLYTLIRRVGRGRFRALVLRGAL